MLRLSAKQKVAIQTIVENGASVAPHLTQIFKIMTRAEREHVVERLEVWYHGIFTLNTGITFISFPGGSDGKVCLECGRPGFSP